MAQVVHAWLDNDTDRMLGELRRRTGLADSELVRRAIRSLALDDGPQVIGIGRFASRSRDVGSNKVHLKGFGCQ